MTCAAHGRGGAAGDHPPGPHLLPQPRLPRRAVATGRSIARSRGSRWPPPTGWRSSRATRARRRCASSSWSRGERGWCCWAPITGSPPCAPTPAPPLRSGATWAGGPSCSASGTDFLHKNRVFAIRLLEALRSEHGWEGSWCSPGPRSPRAARAGEEAAELARRAGPRRARGGPRGGGRGRASAGSWSEPRPSSTRPPRGVRTRPVRGRRGGGALLVRRRDGARRSCLPADGRTAGAVGRARRAPTAASRCCRTPRAHEHVAMLRAAGADAHLAAHGHRAGEPLRGRDRLAARDSRSLDADPAPSPHGQHEPRSLLRNGPRGPRRSAARRDGQAAAGHIHAPAARGARVRARCAPCTRSCACCGGRRAERGAESMSTAAHDPVRWFSEHYDQAADEILAFLGGDGISLEGKRVADVGCGDGIIDLGLGGQGAPEGAGRLRPDGRRPGGPPARRAGGRGRGRAAVVPALRALGAGRASPPTSDTSTWSSPGRSSSTSTIRSACSAEVRRVIKPSGVLFLQLWPFYDSEHGGHLWPHYEGPYPHLPAPRRGDPERRRGPARHGSAPIGRRRVPLAQPDHARRSPARAPGQPLRGRQAQAAHKRRTRAAPAEPLAAERPGGGRCAVDRAAGLSAGQRAPRPRARSAIRLAAPTTLPTWRLPATAAVFGRAASRSISAE